MQEWFEQGAADGFNFMSPALPGDLDDFLTLVIPELQRRGLFRTAYGQHLAGAFRLIGEGMFGRMLVLAVALAVGSAVRRSILAMRAGCAGAGGAWSAASRRPHAGGWSTGPASISCMQSAEQPNPRYTRKLKLEVWYPAQLAAGQKEHTVYTDVLGSGPNDPKRPNTPFQFNGRAVRDAAPAAQGGYPLVIVSHGYPGSRLQMSYLTENLASKGYVVVAIDHLESTRADKAGFASTLLNRRLDDLFVLNTVAAWAKPGSGNSSQAWWMRTTPR
jgi:hypothetical protein